VHDISFRLIVHRVVFLPRTADFASISPPVTRFVLTLRHTVPFINILAPIIPYVSSPLPARPFAMLLILATSIARVSPPTPVFGATHPLCACSGALVPPLFYIIGVLLGIMQLLGVLVEHHAITGSPTQHQMQLATA